MQTGVMTRQGSRKAQWLPYVPGELAYLVRSGLPGQLYLASMRVLYGQLSAAQRSYIVRKGTGGHTQGTSLIADGSLVFLQQSSFGWKTFSMIIAHPHSLYHLGGKMSTQGQKRNYTVSEGLYMPHGHRAACAGSCEIVHDPDLNCGIPLQTLQAGSRRPALL